MEQPPFELPDTPLIDVDTGLATNIPVQFQRWPGWWNDDPSAYERVKRLREKSSVHVEDDLSG